MSNDRPHIVGGKFKSDKYSDVPAGLCPLSITDATAQDLLWIYAERRRSVDAEFADDLQYALREAGFDPLRCLFLATNPPLPASDHALYRANGCEPWPDDKPAQYNGSGTPCDMWTGPCSCGATHKEGV